MERGQMGFAKGLAAAALVAGVALTGCVDPHEGVRAALTEETAALTAVLVEANSGAREVPRRLEDLPREVWPAGLESTRDCEVTAGEVPPFRMPYQFVSGPLEGLGMDYEIMPFGYSALTVRLDRVFSCFWRAYTPEWRC